LRPLAIPPRAGALLAVVFWGVSFVATKAVVREISPVAVIFLRAGLGSALLLAILHRRGQLEVPPRDTWRSLAVMGFVGVAFHQLLQAYALRLTSAVNTGWLIGLTPIWSALLAAAVLRERFSGGKVAGLALGFLGGALVVTRGRIDAGLFALPSTRGDLLILLSTVNWAVYTVIGRATLRRLGAARATAGSMVAGFAMLAVPFAWAGAWRGLLHLSALGWCAILFLGLCCSGLGYFFWYAALDAVEASRVAALLYLEPLVTLAAGVALLAEPVAATTVAGGALLLAGVALVQLAPQRAEA
jgi:drug/metabolite transporter (DMT)-like permease